MTDRSSKRTRRSGGGAYAVSAALSGVMALTAAADVVQRRGGAPPLQGDIERIDDAGVTIRTDLGATHFVPWDRVRQVDSRDSERQIAQHKDNALMLWRARSRIQRNDAALAEPLFERLFETYRARTHETALVVAEGLLRCRLARGEQALAVIPALEAARLRRAGERTITYNSLPAVMDDETSLCIVLPPYWVHSPVLERLYRELRDYNAQGDEVMSALARLYAESVRRTLGIDEDAALTEDDLEALPDHPGVALMAAALRCGSSDAAIRDSTRNQFLTNPVQWPESAQPWMRFFVGHSLLRETGVVRRQRGMMNMLYLPAVYGDTQKFLSGIALHIVAEALEGEGRSQQAASIRQELAARFPYHPIRIGAAAARPGSS